MGLKKNIAYSSLLTASTYLVPLLVFPYISRILGPEGIGAIDSVEYVINYAIVCSMMGLTTLGIREIARHRGNPIELSKTFTNLFFLNLMSTAIVLLLLVALIFSVPEFSKRKELFFIGLTKLLANLFWIEWFFKGIENFKYITLRSLVLRSIFVSAVFLFVRDKDDSALYYTFWVGLTVMNAVCNWNYRRKYAKIDIHEINAKYYLKPFLLLGAFAFLSAIYTQLNVTFLGFVAPDNQVGYYTTSTRLYTVIIALISTVTGVMIPRMSVLMKERRHEEIRRLVDKTFLLLFCFSFPIIIFLEIFAPEAISVFAGKEFLPAVPSMRIVMLLVLVIGTEQIFVMQLLIPSQKEKSILISTMFGVAACLTVNVLFTPVLQSVGSALAWVSAELCVGCCSAYFVKKYLNIRFPLHLFVRCALWASPYVAAGLATDFFITYIPAKLICAATFFALYTFFWSNKMLELNAGQRLLRIFHKSHLEK